jgi:DNA-binding response OmpR family regulator
VHSSTVDKTVLLLEDESDLASLLHELLERHTYRVIRVDSANEAIVLSRSVDRPIDLLIADVQLTPMDGFELAKRFKELSPSTSILLMSGLAREDYPERSYDGAFLRKQFQMSEFIATVRSLSDNSGVPAK